MRVTAAALLALLLAPAAAAHHGGPPLPESEVRLADAYDRLHTAAVRSPRAHAGRDVLGDGRPEDGRLSWALLRREAARLWRALHPAAEAEHAREEIPAWWRAAAARLRSCESGGDYGIETGNGYAGAYQFDYGTWAAVGGAGSPAAAPPEEQDARAYALWKSRGWAPWPACSAALGLR